MVYSIRFFLCFILLLSAAKLFAATEERVTQHTFSLNENGTVDLGNTNGDITIHAWDRNEVDMKITKRGPEEYLDLIEIKIDTTPERLSVETKYPRRRKETNVSVRYEMMVPRRAELNTISNVNGGIDISGVEGTIRIKTVNGSAEIDGSKSSVEATTVNGNIRAKWNEFPESADVRMETVNGRLELHLPENANADVGASSINGSIRTDFPITVQGRFLSRKLSGQIGSGGASIDLHTVNGSIDIVKIN